MQIRLKTSDLIITILMFLVILCQVSGTFADRTSIRRQFLTDIQQAAEDELFYVLYVFLFNCYRLQTSVGHNERVFTIFYVKYFREYLIRKVGEIWFINLDLTGPEHFQIQEYDMGNLSKCLMSKHGSRCCLNTPGEQIKQSRHKILGSLQLLLVLQQL